MYVQTVCMYLACVLCLQIVFVQLSVMVSNGLAVFC